MAKRLLLALLFSAAAWAQRFDLAVSPTTVLAGNPVNLTITFTADATNTVAALQWIITPPMGSTFGTPAFGPIFGGAAAKTVTCNAATANCAAVGLNANVIGTGVAETVQVTVPLSARGLQTISLTNPIGASPAANTVMVNSGTVTFTSMSPFDLNGDSKVDLADLILAARQVVGLDACGTADFDKSGKCDSRDLMLLVIDALGPNP